VEIVHSADIFHDRQWHVYPT